MPYTSHLGASGGHWQHQPRRQGTFIPGLRKTDDCGYAHHSLTSRIGIANRDSQYSSVTNALEIEHSKRVPTSYMNIADKHSSIDFLHDNPDQVGTEQPNKIDHSGVQNMADMELTDREYRLHLEQRFLKGSISGHELRRILVVNGLSTFGDDADLKDRLTAASARVCVNTTPPPLPQPFILAALHPYSHSLTLVFAGSIQGRATRRDQ